jgi:hypothetical protein
MVGDEEACLLLGQDGKPFVLGGEESPEGACRRMRVLVRQQCDLSPKTVEGGLIERPPDKVRANEQRE